MRLRTALAGLVLFLPLRAQDSEVPLAINLPMAQGLEKGDMGLRVTHRFLQAARGASKDAYGLDNSAYTGVGFDTSVAGWWGLNFQVYRTSDQKTVTLALQQKVWEDETVRAALRLERFDETVKDDPNTTLQEGKLGTAVQLPLEWHPAEGLTILAVPTWLSRSNLRRQSLTNVGFAARWDLGPAHGLTGEFYPRPSRLKDVRVGLTPRPLEQGWALAYTYRTRGHRFTVTASTVAGTTAHQVLAGDYAGVGPVASGQWSLGFNLVRIF